MKAIESMTCFGSFTFQASHHWLSEISLLNQCYFDYSVRLPESLRCLKLGSKMRLDKNLQGEKLQCPPSLKNEPYKKINFHFSRLRSLKLNLNPSKKKANYPLTLEAITLFTWPDLLEAIAFSKGIGEKALTLFEKKLNTFIKTRSREGADALKKILLAHLNKLKIKIYSMESPFTKNIAYIRRQLKAKPSAVYETIKHYRTDQAKIIRTEKRAIHEALEGLKIHCLAIKNNLQPATRLGLECVGLAQALNREAHIE